MPAGTAELCDARSAQVHTETAQTFRQGLSILSIPAHYIWNLFLVLHCVFTYFFLKLSCPEKYFCSLLPGGFSEALNWIFFSLGQLLRTVGVFENPSPFLKIPWRIVPYKVRAHNIVGQAISLLARKQPWDRQVAGCHRHS